MTSFVPSSILEVSVIVNFCRSRNNSANQGKISRADGKNFSKAHKNKQNRKTAKANRDYENEEWRTVYIGFVERGTSEAELVHHFKVTYNLIW